MQARRKHASYRHSIIRVRLQATRRGIRDLSTPAVDSELVNARDLLTPRKTPSSIRRRHDKEVGHHWRGNVCVSGSNRDTDLSMEWCDTFSTMIRASEVSLQFWRSLYPGNDQLRRKELFCERHIRINIVTLMKNGQKEQERTEWNSTIMIVKRKFWKNEIAHISPTRHSLMGAGLSLFSVLG